MQIHVENLYKPCILLLAFVCLFNQSAYFSVFFFCLQLQKSLMNVTKDALGYEDLFSLVDDETRAQLEIIARKYIFHAFSQYFE